MDLITFHSLTQAQTAQRRLDTENIKAELRKTPRQYAARGCGYALVVADGTRAAELLRAARLPYSQVVSASADGKREVPR